MLKFKGTYCRDINGSRRENVIFDSKPIDIYIILIRKKNSIDWYQNQIFWKKKF